MARFCDLYCSCLWPRMWLICGLVIVVYSSYIRIYLNGETMLTDLHLPHRLPVLSIVMIAGVIWDIF